MGEVFKISLSKELKDKLDRLADISKTSSNEIVKEALKRYFDKNEFQMIRKKMIPKAEAKGIFNDKDVYKIIS